MLIMMSNSCRKLMLYALEKEQEKNPAAVFRIWETTVGRYDDARIQLRVSLDQREEDDEFYVCCNLPFVASRDFLSLRGEPHLFYIYNDETGKPVIMEISG